MIFVVTTCIAVPIISVFFLFVCFFLFVIYSFSFAVTIFFSMLRLYISNIYISLTGIISSWYQVIYNFFLSYSIIILFVIQHSCLCKQAAWSPLVQRAHEVRDLLLIFRFLSEQTTQSRSFRPSSFFTLTCGFTLWPAFLFVK